MIELRPLIRFEGRGLKDDVHKTFIRQKRKKGKLKKNRLAIWKNVTEEGEKMVGRITTIILFLSV